MVLAGRVGSSAGARFFSSQARRRCLPLASHTEYACRRGSDKEVVLVGGDLSEICRELVGNM